MNFSNPSDYAKYSVIQKEIGKELIEFASREIRESKTLLDIGCGTGFLGIEALNFNSNLQITGIEVSSAMCLVSGEVYKNVLCRNIEEKFDFEEKFDVILSSMCLQWVKKQSEVIEKILKYKNKNFYFAIPMPQSLSEINDCFEQSFLASPIIKFQSPPNPSYIKVYEEKYESLSKALKSFNKIGAKNPAYKTKLKVSDFRKLEKNFPKKITWEIGFYKY
jgi:ubiquinone/menaquinone biosynthesis C-methylase UbiE